MYISKIILVSRQLKIIQLCICITSNTIIIKDLLFKWIIPLKFGPYGEGFFLNPRGGVCCRFGGRRDQRVYSPEWWLFHLAQALKFIFQTCVFFYFS